MSAEVPVRGGPGGRRVGGRVGGGARGRVAPAASVGFALLAAAVGLFIAYAMKQPCLSHGWANFFQYRHLCYNDIQPLFYGRKVSTGAVPYKDVTVEYPVLIGSFMYGVGRLLALLVKLNVAGTYSDPQYFQLTAVLLAPCSVAITMLLRPRVTRARLLLWAIGTPTILYSFLNWDLLAVVCLIWGLVEVERKRWGWAGIALGLGASAKLFPGFALPAVFLAVIAVGDRRGARRLVAGFVGTVAAANLPWMVATFSGWMGIWKFQAGRYPDFGTIWYWVARVAAQYSSSPFWESPGGWGGFIGEAGMVGFGLGSLMLLWIGWRRRQEPGGYPVAAVTLGILALFLVLSKVNSPQYALWIAPLLVLLDVPWWQIGFYLATDLLLFVSGFYWFTVPDFPGPSGWQHLFTLAVFARALALLFFVLRAAGRATRLRPGLPAPAPPEEPVGDPAVDVAGPVGELAADLPDRGEPVVPPVQEGEPALP
ncbi:MAG TPA: glycosyltransferase 87 family protein [Actinomycetota bacterium]|nr:glycosyltransferase 87 family protein [Actinomycetota bacterium]